MVRPTSQSKLEVYDLLPPAFRRERRVRHIACMWTTVVCSLLAVLVGTAIASTLRIERQRRAQQQLLAESLPLFDLRQNVLKLQQGNTEREKWCQWVETARPSDDAFQTLATIAATVEAATDHDTDQIKIDRINLRLPVEYPTDSEEVPEWAKGHLEVAARLQSPALAERWAEQLGHSDRIEAARVEEEDTPLEGAALEIKATPVASRVMP